MKSLIAPIALLGILAAPVHAQQEGHQHHPEGHGPTGEENAEMMADRDAMHARHQEMMAKHKEMKAKCKEIMDGSEEIKAKCKKMMAGHAGHDMHKMHGEHQAKMMEGAMGTLKAYRDALVALDADAMTSLFAEDSHVFENGKYEGSFADYMEHHLGPELHAIKSFTFTDPTIDVEVMGHMALGRETYRYDITLDDGREIARQGTATSVLKHDATGWKIIRYHSSSRTPR
ncbi:YybH family protein [Sphingomicrobium lutaoense]|uniref:Ketosteroid isomerase-like protein n=1 Tax=Sphingomicrobium lutaoense TaxID=515949 RepID=A0A839YXL1_9SPHN|nr:nuclear transport factor 2 family protein [Sphingomicrobium lutaoense]MBB3764931.1 ketosteroid isomerase-like protein [Sphingomicrobium lutaoense]